MTDAELKANIVRIAKGCGKDLKCADDLADWFMCDTKYVANEDASQEVANLMNEVLKVRLKQIWEAE